jgi:pyruvate,water dikinase
VTFSEIKNVSVLCELVTMRKGLTPDISLGTHFFNDLVEMGIVYMGLYPEKDGHVLNESLLLQASSPLAEIYQQKDRAAGAIFVAEFKADSIGVLMHANTIGQEGVVFLDRQ